LPAPFGPRIPKQIPGSISKSTPQTTSRSPNRLDTPVALTTAFVIASISHNIAQLQWQDFRLIVAYGLARLNAGLRLRFISDFSDVNG
jgi:hypothetical protein